MSQLLQLFVITFHSLLIIKCIISEVSILKSLIYDKLDFHLYKIIHFLCNLPCTIFVAYKKNIFLSTAVILFIFSHVLFLSRSFFVFMFYI